jgi:hypothetical protein
MPARKRSKLHKKTLPQLREPARVRLRRKFHIRSLDELKRDAVKRVLKVTGGRSRLAAKLLCVGVTSIYRWQQEFGIPSLYTGPYRRFGRVQRVRTAPQLRRKTGIKTLREQREDQVARVLTHQGACAFNRGAAGDRQEARLSPYIQQPNATIPQTSIQALTQTIWKKALRQENADGDTKLTR